MSNRTSYFAELVDDFVELNSLDADLWAYRDERRLAAALHAQALQFFLGLEVVAGEPGTTASRGQLLQRALAMAERMGVVADDGDPDLFDQFAFMKAVAERVGFDAVYSAGIAPDGSISVLIGPGLPDIEEIGIRGAREHSAGELRAALALARTATRVVAQVAAVAKYGTPQERGEVAARELSACLPASADEVDAEAYHHLVGLAVPHFKVWWLSSEDELVRWVTDLMHRSGLLKFDSSLSRAVSAAYLMSLWAVHLEFAAHSDEGTVGDWIYGVSDWVNDGISEDQVALLNEHLELGWPLDDEEYEVSMSEVCADIVRRSSSAVVDLLKKELGVSFTFAYLWAARFGDMTYPIDGEMINDIVNGDVEDKVEAYHWVENGMGL